MKNTMGRIRKTVILIPLGLVFILVLLINVSFLRPVSFSAEKTVTCPTDGKFHIVQAVICDPDGKPFLPKGINEFAGQTYANFGESSNIATPGIISNYVDGWKFNILRIVMCPTGPCQSHPFTTQGTDLDALINAYTAKKVVIMFDYHQLPLASPPSQGDITTAANWFKQMAVKYKDNPYVWLESFNEPIDGNGGIQQWAGFSTQIVDAIRSVNPDKVIVLNSGNYGQDSAGNGSSFDTGGSHILAAGPALAAKGNVVFDVHFYSRWQGVNTTGTKAYFAAIHNAGMAVLVGETWGDPNGADFMRGDQMATDILYAARPNGVGILPWSAGGNYPGVNGGSTRDVNTNSNLTHNGQLHWNWTHSPPSAVPDGYTVTTGGGGSPTTGPSMSPVPGTCPKKGQGDADCNGTLSITDYAVWRAEYKGGCTSTNLTALACGDNKDNIGSIMDADFNADNKVSLADYQIWRVAFVGGGSQISIVPSTSPTPNVNGQDTQLKITINDTGQGSVTLENSVMKTVYRSFFIDEANQAAGYNFAIREWMYKKTGRDIARQADGRAQDNYDTVWCYTGTHADIPKFKITSTMVSDGADSKSVRIRDDGCQGSEVWTIYAHSPVIKIVYENIPDHVFDDRNQRHNVGSPGALLPQPHDFTVYMNGSWHNTQCDQSGSGWCEVGVFNNPSPEGEPSDPSNGGALNYNGSIIFGYTEKATGLGFGRSTPVANLSWIANQLNLSEELLTKNRPFTAYLYMVTGGGPTEVLSTGKAVTDGTIPKK